ncbi:MULTISPECIES: hypothetical protein [unclassified Streptomyces]|uniref:hypothetical protein n=1 Tax=unclassified Streptomyces TaxID=2593676 RepID=UPI003D75EEF8
MTANGGNVAGDGVPDTGKAFDTLAGVNPQMALNIQHSSLTSFKKRVDELLIELDRSEAAPGKVGQDRLPRVELGSSDFKEAQFLYDSYTIVHDELENLSKALGAQIEAMGLAVHASRVGYENLDADLRARMKQINAEAEKYYVVDRDPYAQPQRTSTAPTPAQNSEEGL